MKDTTLIRICPRKSSHKTGRNIRCRADIATRSNKGRVRETNEDSFLVVQLPESDNLLMGVADGVSGGQAGEIASRYALQSVLKTYMQQTETGSSIAGPEIAADILVRGITDANKRLDHLNSNLGGRHFMVGTTITAMILLPDKGVVANAGDSRAYQFRDSRLNQLTKDHTWAQNLVDIGEIQADAVRGHPWEHTLSSCLGTLPEIEPSIRYFTRAKGDKYLLCTDGVTQMVDSGELRDILEQDKAAAEIAEEIVVQSLHRGGVDNLTLTLSC